ncbi:MAG: stage II sporulation protein P, partial [Porcipelethomonas sp.]
MRRRRKKNGRTKKIILFSAAVIAVSTAAVKTFPQIARAAFSLTGKSIDFSSEPDNYTGEYDTDYFNIFGSSIEKEPEPEKETEAAAAVSADPGPKPYPEEWNIEDCTVTPETFGRYTGEKYIGLENGGQVRNETDISNAQLIEESSKLPEFKISLDGSPQVLIMHTHTTESFEPYERDFFDPSFNYRTTDPSKNTVMVGDEITKQLEDAGIGVIHDTTIHDYPSYNGSYERSAETVKKILKENPTIKVVLDIHRDAVGTSENIIQPTATINGKKAAQVMIISGCDDGTLDMPDYMKNFRFASLLQQQMSSDYP